jgi:TolB-like protein/Flp pilus assembly protein TadD
MMSSARWQDIEKIFQAAIDLAPEERAGYVERACADDAELRREVLALIKQHEEAGEFLDKPLYERSGIQQLAEMLEGDFDSLIGKRIGKYRIVREIGRGGMGAVYLAEPDEDAGASRVAIKVIKRGMDTDFVLKRFRHEQRILAALDHPYIARLLDGGATREGQPYFIMEYIEGQPLYAYCDGQRLTLSERLKIFCQVCEAVEYLHLKQVIHRDIKPSNILVTEDGTPRLFDFGIAKLLDAGLTNDSTPQTATSMRLMTVEYASPEQVQGLPVTFLSDVYSLGVLLYELLTGHRPHNFRSRFLHEMARVITEEEPDRPSAVVTRPNHLLTVAHVSHEDVTIGHLCELRGETPESLSQHLSGSLDRITLKALRKEPGQRYQSAAELREDIVRYLEGRPVAAPVYVPHTIKQEASPARVEKEQLSIAVLPFKLMSVRSEGETGDEFLGVGLADALITRLSNVRRLVVRPTSSILPYTSRREEAFTAGEELGVGFVLDGYVQRSGDRLRVSVQLLNVAERTTVWAKAFHEDFTDVFSIQDSISTLVAEALLPHLSGTEREQLAKHGTDNAEAFELYLRGRYHLSLVTPESFSKALDYFERSVALDPNYALAFSAMADCYFYMGAFATAPPSECAQKARVMAERAIALDEALGEAYAILGYVTFYYDLDPAEAERLLRYGLRLSPNHATGHVWQSVTMAARGNYYEALTEAKLAAELDPASPFNQQHVCWILYQSRRTEEALALARKVMESAPDFAHVRGTYGWMLRHAGRYEEAIEQGRRAVELSKETPWLLASLAASCARAGQTEEALGLLRQLEEMSASRYISPFNLAIVHLHLGQRERALELLEESLATRDVWIVWMLTEPQLDTLRDDTRFLALARRMNVPQAPQTRAEVEAQPVEPAQRSEQPVQGERSAPVEKAAIVEKGAPVESAAASEKSVAILPFKMLGAGGASDTGDDYLGVGLSDALITRLSNVRRLVVRPTSSVIQYGKEGDPVEAGERLGVDYVVEGNIRRAGDTLRVTVRLLNVREHATRWAGKFDEKSTDVLLLEDLISEQVAVALIPQLTGEEQEQLAKRGTNNAQAYEAYLRGRYHFHSLTEEGFAKSLQDYYRAISFDPNYALAYAGIADYHIFLGIYGIMPFAESSAAAKEAAQRAVELDDTLAEAYAALAFATVCHDFDWRTAEELHLRAIALNPNSATAHNWYAFMLMQEGRFPLAFAEVGRSLELDPISPLTAMSLAWCYYHSRRINEALSAYRKIIESEPHFGYGRLVFSWALRYAGHHAEAIAQAKKAVELAGDGQLYLAGLAAAYAGAGRVQEAQEIIWRLEQMSATRYVSPYCMALIYCYLNDMERALALIEEAINIGDAWATWIGVDPQLDPLRDDPRFQELQQRWGLGQYSKTKV